MKYKYLLLIPVLLICLSCAVHAQSVTKDIAAQRAMQHFGVDARILRPYSLLQDKSSRSDGRFLLEFDGDPGFSILLDRDYWVIVGTDAAKKRDAIVYSFNPKDGQCAMNISFGNLGIYLTQPLRKVVFLHG